MRKRLAAAPDVTRYLSRGAEGAPLPPLTKRTAPASKRKPAPPLSTKGGEEVDVSDDDDDEVDEEEEDDDEEEEAEADPAARYPQTTSAKAGGASALAKGSIERLRALGWECPGPISGNTYAPDRILDETDEVPPPPTCSTHHPPSL